MNPELEKAKARVVFESPVHGPVLLAEIARLQSELDRLDHLLEPLR